MMVVNQLTAALQAVTVEPVMLIDGACQQVMLLFVEIVQMNKICSNSLGLPDKVCGNLSSYPEENVLVQREFILFSFYNSIILSLPPLISVLFMGAWSDKYGRKIPLLITVGGHLCYAGGYLLNNLMPAWPVEILYLVTVFEAFGGANVGFLSIVNSYISDVCDQKSRTSRISTANSLWYLGGPLGLLIGALILAQLGLNVALGIVFLGYLFNFIYVTYFIKESRGPFARKYNIPETQIKAINREPDNSAPNIEPDDLSCCRMLTDFFNWRRVAEAFQTAFKKREGNARGILMCVIAGNMIRRVARGFYMYMFVRTALDWEATDYGYWASYKYLLAAIGSLFLVPPLTRLLKVSDTSLIAMGSLSVISEYLCYGFVFGVSQTFLMWLGPLLGLLSNSTVIAFRSMATKLVTPSENGRINSVLAAMNGLMPMVAYGTYTAVYNASLATFPSAQFFYGAALNFVVFVMFVTVHFVNKAREASQVEEDLDPVLTEAASSAGASVAVIQVTENTVGSFPKGATEPEVVQDSHKYSYPNCHEPKPAGDLSYKILGFHRQRQGYRNFINEEVMIMDEATPSMHIEDEVPQGPVLRERRVDM